MNSFRKLRIGLWGLLLAGASLGLTSCFDDADSVPEQYREWRQQNMDYVTAAEAKTDADGKPYYTKITPTWAPDGYVLVHWHNDRSLTAGNLSPMDNSTVQMKYQLFDINDKEISNSYSNTDSVYTSRPLQNIIGMQVAMTHMHVGDSVTMVIPYQSGYGEKVHSDIPPYSTLIYNVKMKAITAYEVP